MKWKGCSILISLLISGSAGQEDGSGEEGSGSGSGDGVLEIPEVINSVDYSMSSSDGSFDIRSISTQVRKLRINPRCCQVEPGKQKSSRKCSAPSDL